MPAWMGETSQGTSFRYGIYVCVCMHACVCLSVYVYMSTCMCTYEYVYTYMYVYMYKYVCICMYIHVCRYIYMYVCGWVHICMYKYVYVYMCVWICVCIYVCSLSPTNMTKECPMWPCFHPNQDNTPQQYFVYVISKCPTYLFTLYKNSIKHISIFILIDIQKLQNISSFQLGMYSACIVS